MTDQDVFTFPDGMMICRALEHEAQNILNDPTVHYREFTPPASGPDVWLLTHGKLKALFHAKIDGNRIVDLHIAVPWRSRQRMVMDRIMNWCHHRGALAAITYAPESRVTICRMLKKLGFQRIGTKGDEIIFFRRLYG